MRIKNKKSTMGVGIKTSAKDIIMPFPAGDKNMKGEGRGGREGKNQKRREREERGRRRHTFSALQIYHFRCQQLSLLDLNPHST